jgi:hypothetical protein
MRERSVNPWESPAHALEYLARADSIPHRTEGEAELLQWLRMTPIKRDGVQRHARGCLLNMRSSSRGERIDRIDRSGTPRGLQGHAVALAAWFADTFTPVNSVTVLLDASRAAAPSDTAPVVLADAGVENVNAQVDELIHTGVLRRVLAFTELKFTNSLIEPWWRSLKHQWLFLHSPDSVATVRRLVALYVDEHNRVLPLSAFRGQTPDEMFFPCRDSQKVVLLNAIHVVEPADEPPAAGQLAHGKYQVVSAFSQGQVYGVVFGIHDAQKSGVSEALRTEAAVPDSIVQKNAHVIAISDIELL